MYVFTQKASSALEPTLTLALTADERTRSRYRYSISSEITESDCQTTNSAVGEAEPQTAEIYLQLPRGTTLRDGDCLIGDGHAQVLRIVAKPEPVMTVRTTPSDQSASTQPALKLLQAAYHLGNRHVALELGTDYLRLAPDSVLEAMLNQLGVMVTVETVPFQPEMGAYGHHH
ncbi:urease accessory protein [Leptolyngbya sp. Heron Island J]|uniref:urease accessory protein UreE n=1 Tax=Leptolyngbya sp. Heron Island J TaxID=1385935 RepID=UPI0003B95C01|nr:urease accessory protein UreE [Leptolyngbya sp. Heron Island J]ESA35582.1 urease accessory protein [Leptolyngbya sp. Heron Island J]